MRQRDYFSTLENSTASTKIGRAKIRIREERKKEPTISFVVPFLNLARNPTTSENVNFRALKAEEPSIA